MIKIRTKDTLIFTDTAKVQLVRADYDSDSDYEVAVDAAITEYLPDLGKTYEELTN